MTSFIAKPMMPVMALATTRRTAIAWNAAAELK